MHCRLSIIVKAAKNVVIRHTWVRATRRDTERYESLKVKGLLPGLEYQG